MGGVWWMNFRTEAANFTNTTYVMQDCDYNQRLRKNRLIILSQYTFLNVEIQYPGPHVRTVCNF